MEFKTLEYIVAIAEYQNITRAAESLYISQSGLNQMLLKEEHALGTKLFFRSKKSLHATPAGTIYVENAKRILKLAQNVTSQIHDLSNCPSGSISFGLPFEHGVDLFVTISQEFQKQYPNVSIQMKEMTVQEMKDNIKSDKLDLAFVMLPQNPEDEFEYVKLCTEKLVLGVPIRHTLAQYASPRGKVRATIDLSRFRNEQFALMFSGSTMRAVIDPLFSSAGFQPKVHYETLMNRALQRLVKKGLCCTILPQSYAVPSKDIAWFYLEEDPSWNWYIIYSRNRYLSAVDKYLVQLALDYAQMMQKHWDLFGGGSPDD